MNGGGVKDSGWLGSFKKLIESEIKAVTVGVHEDETERELDPDFQTNAEIGYLHEFGLGVPQRSFLREPFDEYRQELTEKQRLLFRSAATGRIDNSQIMPLLGETAASLLKNNIQDHIPPPLSPVTVALKNSSTPLIDSGQLINAIDYKVES